MINQTLLTKAIEIIGVLFAAFGGFLIGIAPPRQADAKFAVGTGSFLCLITLLLIKAYAQGRPEKKYRRRWIVVAVTFLILFVTSAFVYKQKFDELVFTYPPQSADVEVAGTTLTAEAQKYRNDNHNMDNTTLLFHFGGVEKFYRVWPEAAVRNARMWLIGSYLAVVLTLTTALFALTEGVFGNGKPKRPPAARRP